ncbi:MAG: hypothetical protein HKO56_02210 [Bacteroidia bacterium]|nr:hypothetical protein [Bacteroidia bacterium]NNM15444.1 hypothetical protein [Bacteroidia bacterium]
MKRRDFVKSLGVATAGAFVAPYILPSGRLFAASGARRANHVVFCLYAGGIRNFESVQKAEGNLMTNVLNGTEPIKPDILPGLDPIMPGPLSQPLQNYGTLFKQFRYAQGPTGHFNGHTTAVTGAYTQNDIDIRSNPDEATVFEYYRKHNSPAGNALNSWWVSNTLGPYPALNFSKKEGYGSQYGANFIAPTNLISQSGYDALGNMKTFSSAELNKVKEIRSYLDSGFAGVAGAGDAGVTNTEADTILLQNFIQQLFNEAISGQHNNPWNFPGGGIMNNDMYNIFYAEKIIQEFTPELLVVNMQGVDICHTNFTGYCNNLRKADFAVAHLWDTIQNTPGMANDTVLIMAPEHGRNLNSNSTVDAYGRFAFDHTGDQTSREIFCLIAGPPGVVNQGLEVNAISGESIDIVPTIADVLGFDTDIPAGMLSGTSLGAAFV